MLDGRSSKCQGHEPGNSDGMIIWFVLGRAVQGHYGWYLLASTVGSQKNVKLFRQTVSSSPFDFLPGPATNSALSLISSVWPGGSSMYLGRLMMEASVLSPLPL